MTTVSFTGDVAFSHYFRNSGASDDVLAEEVVEFLRASDYTVLNVEGAVVSEDASSKPFIHTTSTQAVELFLKMNANIWNLANNHTMDCNGAIGLASTIDTAQKNGCTTIGAGMSEQQAEEPVLIEKDGGIGIVSVVYEEGIALATGNTAGCCGWNMDRVKRLVQKVKERHRWCVLVVHGGDEFSHMPMPYIRRRYHKYLSFGADIVVAHHPHVVQNYETVGNKAIFYSLGNFVFDTDYQRQRFGTDVGMLLKICFDVEKFAFEYFPVSINREKNRVEKGNTPEIFCDISGKRYHKLWPIAAAALTHTERKRGSFIDPEGCGKFSEWRWLWQELKSCKRIQGRTVQCGRVLSKLQRGVEQDAIVAYLKCVY